MSAPKSTKRRDLVQLMRPEKFRDSDSDSESDEQLDEMTDDLAEALGIELED